MRPTQTVTSCVIIGQMFRIELSSKSVDPAIDRLTLDRVLEIVQQLPPSYRTTYLLHVVEGYSHPEIAKNLGGVAG